MKPKRRYLPTLPQQAPTEEQLLLDALHDLNGKIQFVYEQLAIVAAAVPVSIEPMED